MKKEPEINQVPLTSLDERETRIETLRRLFPDLFDGDGVLDEKALRTLLADEVPNVGERFRFEWAGKTQSKRFAFSPSKATLVFDPARSINADGSELHEDASIEACSSDNLIIEADNLEALKLLSKSYFEQVKCIYIDPPYNTKSDFIYPDDFSERRQEYWEKNGTIKQGVKLTALTESAGRRHSNWLNMMQARLLLARQLLRPDGVIFMSIDENEFHNLRKLGEEVFGEENYAGEIVWKNSSKNDQDYISIQHEYFLCFAKSKIDNDGQWQEKKEGLDKIYKAFAGFKKKHSNNWDAIHEEALEWYKQFPDSDPIKESKHYNWMDERGVYFAADISGPNYGQYRYDVVHPVTGKVCKEPASGWRFPEETMKQRIKDGLVHFGKDETTVPNNKTYLKNTEYQSLTSIKYRDGRVASKYLRRLLGGNYFTNPKDVDLMASFLKAVGVGDGDIVLDFFAGSGTTGESVLSLNADDGLKRKYVLIQLPEVIDEKEEAYKAGYRVISDITIDRMKKAGAKYTEESQVSLDTGFRTLRLTYSNFPENTFTPDPSKSEEENLKALDAHLVAAAQKTIFDDGNFGSVVTEIALKFGFGLFYQTQHLGEKFTRNAVHRIEGNDKGALLCLDEDLHDETIEALKAHGDEQLIVAKVALDTTKKFELHNAFKDNLWVV